MSGFFWDPKILYLPGDGRDAILYPVDARMNDRLDVRCYGVAVTARRVLLGVLVAACGRIGFDPIANVDDGLDPGADPLAPAMDGARDRDDAPPGVADAAPPPTETCPAGQTCESACPAGCEYVCEAGATCQIECPTSDCSMLCGPFADCTLHCGTIPLDGTCAANGGTEGGLTLSCTGPSRCGAS